MYASLVVVVAFWCGQKDYVFAHVLGEQDPCVLPQGLFVCAHEEVTDAGMFSASALFA
jgi:hypothetical protein